MEESQILVLREAVLCRDRDSPGKGRRRAIEFLVDKVRQAPNPLPDQCRGTRRIEEEPGVELILTEIVQQSQTAKQESAEDM